MILCSMLLYFLMIQFHGEYCVIAYPIQTNNNRNNQAHDISTVNSYKVTIDASDDDIPTKNDIDSITRQLGYVPPNFIKVSARRENGQPLTLQTYPLNGGAAAARRERKKEDDSLMIIPFPTLYWFCCPDVGRAIADLERTGHVNLLQQKLESNPTYIERWYQNHDTYAKQRWLSLTDEHRSMLSSSPTSTNSDDILTPKTCERMRQMLQESGIAGIYYNRKETNVPSIKCLHANYAHYRSCIKHTTLPSHLNIVGEWTHELLQELYPDLML